MGFYERLSPAFPIVNSFRPRPVWPSPRPAINLYLTAANVDTYPGLRNRRKTILRYERAACSDRVRVEPARSVSPLRDLENHEKQLPFPVTDTYTRSGQSVRFRIPLETTRWIVDWVF